MKSLIGREALDKYENKNQYLGTIRSHPHIRHDGGLYVAIEDKEGNLFQHDIKYIKLLPENWDKK